MTDHEYKAGWMGLRGDKSCKVCGQGRGAHWKPVLDTLTPEEVESFNLPAHPGACDCVECQEAYGSRK